MSKIQLFLGKEHSISLAEKLNKSPEGSLLSVVHAFEKTAGVSEEMYLTSFFNTDTREYSLIALQVMKGSGHVVTVQKTFGFKCGKWIEPNVSEIEFDC